MVLTIIALGAIVVAIAAARFDNWAPNVATEALSIAVTIAVVERIVQRENRRRVQPRINRALRVLSSAYIILSRQAAFDYAGTHLTEDPGAIRVDPVEVLRFWQDRFGTEDRPRSRMSDGLPLLLSEGVKFVQKAQLIADSDRELLPADLVIAIDNLSQTFGGQGHLFLDLVEEAKAPERGGQGNWLCLVLVENARHLGEVLRRHGAV